MKRRNEAPTSSPTAGPSKSSPNPKKTASPTPRESPASPKPRKEKTASPSPKPPIKRAKAAPPPSPHPLARAQAHAQAQAQQPFFAFAAARRSTPPPAPRRLEWTPPPPPRRDATPTIPVAPGSPKGRWLNVAKHAVIALENPDEEVSRMLKKWLYTLDPIKMDAKSHAFWEEHLVPAMENNEDYQNYRIIQDYLREHEGGGGRR